MKTNPKKMVYRNVSITKGNLRMGIKPRHLSWYAHSPAAPGAELLIAAGADVNEEDALGRTPLVHAQSRVPSLCNAVLRYHN